MPPKASYADRVYTTSVVSYPEMRHIGPDKDFTPLIEQAIALGGYAEEQRFTGINGGTSVTTGFARNAVLSVADKVVDGVKSGAIRHFFLVGGCDGARPAAIITLISSSRPRRTPSSSRSPAANTASTTSTLARSAAFPRLLDIGQCNDAYSAIRSR